MKSGWTSRWASIEEATLLKTMTRHRQQEHMSASDEAVSWERHRGGMCRAQSLPPHGTISTYLRQRREDKTNSVTTLELSYAGDDLSPAGRVGHRSPTKLAHHPRLGISRGHFTSFLQPWGLFNTVHRSQMEKPGGRTVPKRQWRSPAERQWRLAGECADSVLELYGG